jgi:hypothetical protein
VYLNRAHKTTFLPGRWRVFFLWVLSAFFNDVHVSSLQAPRQKKKRRKSASIKIYYYTTATIKTQNYLLDSIFSTLAMATSLHPSNAFNHRFTPTSYKHRNLNFYRRFPSSFSGRFRVLTYRGSGHGGCSSSSLSKRVMLIIRRLRRLLFNKRKRTTTNVLLLISISLSFLLVSLSKPIPAPL